MVDGVERLFQYLLLPFGWSRSGYWFCRHVQRFWMMVKKTLGYRVVSYVDDFAIAPSLGRAATAADCRKASRHIDELLRMYGLTRHLLKGVWSAFSQCQQHLGFVIDTHRGLFGGDLRHGAADAIASAAQQETGQGGHTGEFYRESAESAFGGGRRGVPAASIVRLRSEPGTGWDPFRHFWQALPGDSYDAYLTSRAEAPPVLVGLASEAAPPPHLAKGAQADCYGSHRRVDVGLWSDTVSRGAPVWDPGYLRMSWLLGRFSQGIGAHYRAGIYDGEIGLEGVFGILCSARERSGQVVHRQHGGHVVVKQWVSKSPAIMAELRRLH
jgi:hypothetical protein